VKSKATRQPFATKKIMADDSNEEETGSQGTRQSARNNEGSNGSYKRGAYRGNRNDKNNLQGNIAELGNNVYQYGTRDQSDRFTRTTEAIADYVGREYSKELTFKTHEVQYGYWTICQTVRRVLTMRQQDNKQSPNGEP
jgi:uncharacterized protein YjcR